MVRITKYRNTFDDFFRVYGGEGILNCKDLNCRNGVEKMCVMTAMSTEPA
jgi:hypothetical protein